MRDLTKGSIGKGLLTFAVPIFFGQLFQLCYSLTDTKLVGAYLGESALAAVGGVSVLCNLMIIFMNALGNGFAIPIARFFGGHKNFEVKKAFAGSILLGGVLSIVLTLFCTFFMDALMLFMKIDASIYSDAKTYCQVLMSGILITFTYNLCAAVLRALGNSIIPLILLMISSVLNIFLDIFFIKNLHLGVFGASLATILAQAVSALCCILYIILKYEILHISFSHFKPEKLLWRELISSGLSMAFMGSFVQMGTVFLQTSINGLGQDIMIAHTAARKVTEILMMPFSIMGTALCTFIGQNVGAGKWDRVRKGIKTGIVFGALVWIIAILSANTIAPFLVRIITSSNHPIIIQTAWNYLRFDTLFYMVAACISLFRNSLQGMGDTRTPIFSSSLELIGKLLFARFLVPVFGYWAVIVTEPLIWIIMIQPLIFKVIPLLKKKN